MKEILYTDKLVEITQDSIWLRNYYFPFGSKTVKLNDVEKVKVLRPTLLNGKWRIHGTGDFRTWFARDTHRPVREKIFVLFLYRHWCRIGFTVENANRVKQILNDKGLSIICQE